MATQSQQPNRPASAQQPQGQRGQGNSQIIFHGWQGRPPHAPRLLRDMGLGVIKGPIIFWRCTVARPRYGLSGQAPHGSL